MITLTQPTDSFIPAFNRVLFDIVSDIASQTGFRYAVKVYNGDTNALITIAYYDTPPVSSDPVQFDVSRFLSEGYDWEDNINGGSTWTYNESILNRFYLKCYEYYDVAGNGIYAIDPASEVVSNTYVVFGGGFSFFDRGVYTDSKFDGSSTTAYYPLTDQLNTSIVSTDWKVFTFYNPSNNITKIEIKRWDNGVSTIINSLPTANPSSYDLTNFYFSPTSFGYSATTDYFELTIYWSVGLNTYNIKFATITPLSCSRYDSVQLLWVNRFGSLDSYSFNRKSSTSMSAEMKTYNTQYTDLGRNTIGSTNYYTNTMPVFYVKEKRMLTLNTDFLTDSESVFFQQLFGSPLVYMKMEGDYSGESFSGIQNDAYIPVKLTSNAYDIRKKINDKLFQVQVQVELSEPSYRQII